MESTVLLNPTATQVIDALSTNEFTTMHVAAHGEENRIILGSPHGEHLTIDDMVGVLAASTSRMGLITLGTCSSYVLAHNLVNRNLTGYVIYTLYDVEDALASAFFGGFYQRYGSGSGVPHAFSLSLLDGQVNGYFTRTVSFGLLASPYLLNNVGRDLRLNLHYHSKTLSREGIERATGMLLSGYDRAT